MACPSLVGSVWDLTDLVSYRIMGFNADSSRLWFWSNGAQAHGYFEWPDLTPVVDDRGGAITFPLGPSDTVDTDENLYVVGGSGGGESVTRYDLAGADTVIYNTAAQDWGIQLRWNEPKGMLWGLTQAPALAMRLMEIDPGGGGSSVLEADLPEPYNLAIASDGAAWWVDPIDGGVARWVEGTGFAGFHTMTVTAATALFPVEGGGMLLYDGSQVLRFTSSMGVTTLSCTPDDPAVDGVSYHAFSWDQGFTAVTLGDVNDPDVAVYRVRLVAGRWQWGSAAW